MSNTIYVVVKDSIDRDFSEIDLLSEMINHDDVDYFGSISELIYYNDTDEDISDCKIFVLTVESKGIIKNNPKFVTFEDLKKQSKKK